MKLIIDIPDMAYEAYKEWHKQRVSSVEQSLIALAMPYEERPHGKWIKHTFNTCLGLGEWSYKCSECNKVYYGKHNFCPNCGADMRDGGNGTEG